MIQNLNRMTIHNNKHSQPTIKPCPPPNARTNHQAKTMPKLKNNTETQLVLDPSCTTQVLAGIWKPQGITHLHSRTIIAGDTEVLYCRQRDAGHYWLSTKGARVCKSVRVSTVATIYPGRPGALIIIRDSKEKTECSCGS
jgi:hypothetical protein